MRGAISALITGALLILVIGLVLYPFVQIKPDLDSSFENVTASRYPQVKTVTDYIWSALPFILLILIGVFVIVGRSIYERFGGFIQ